MAALGGSIPGPGPRPVPDTDNRAPAADERYWRRLVAVFFAGWVLMYANRTVLSPLLSLLEGQWSMTRAQLGLLNSAFFLMYTLMQVPTGLLADRLGRRRLLLPGYLLHAVGAALSGLAHSAQTFLAARVVTGLGQSTYYATQYALASAVIPRRYRALGMAVINSGMAVGIALGMLAASASLAGQGTSWRVPFLSLAAATLLLYVVMSRVVHDEHPPALAAPAAAGERAGAADGSPGPTTQARVPGRPGLGAAFARNTVLCYLVALCSMYGFFVILTWLPYYLETQRGVSGVGSGVVSATIAFAAVPAGLLAGRISDRIGRRRPVLLLLVPVSGLALAGIVLAPSVASAYGAVLLYGITGKLVMDPLLVALVADATPAQGYGTAFGILNFAGTISTVLAPAITGHLADLTGSFVSAFLLAAALQIVAAAALAAMRSERQAGGSPRQAANS